MGVVVFSAVVVSIVSPPRNDIAALKRRSRYLRIALAFQGRYKSRNAENSITENSGIFKRRRYELRARFFTETDLGAAELR